jgi:hypothetical protein
MTLYGATQANAQSDGKLSLSAKVGFDGYCTENSWLPIRVDIQNSGQDLNGVVEATYKNSTSQSTIKHTAVER